jgi:hypothetical protein
MKPYHPIYKKKYWIKIKLDEGLTFSDFKNHAGLSMFTKFFRKQRNEILKGSENKTAKIKQLVLSPKKDYVTFIFKTIPTKKPASKTDPNRNFSLSGANTYTMEIRILNFFTWLKSVTDLSETNEFTLKDLKEILKVADIQLYCNDPSFHWQGMNAHLSQLDASIYPTDIPPHYWDHYHRGDQLLCKHLSGLISQFGFFQNNMSAMLNKALKQITNK